MRFQDRDGEILQTIHKYGGMLARRHLKEIFWPDTTLRAMNKRLTPLQRANYICWPSDEDYRTQSGISEPIVWLGPKGILHIAGQQGHAIQEPKNLGENQMRILHDTLRTCGINWLRQPNWQDISHDLKVVEFRFAIENALTSTPQLNMEYWILEREFRSRPDKVEFTYKGQPYSRRVVPDGYFVIVDEQRRANQQNFRVRFLLELDMGSHDNPSVDVEKFAAGAAYLQSSVYKERFGVNAGRWLVVTKGAIRMKHFMERVYGATGQAAGLFLFSHLDLIANANPLMSPVWFRVGKREPLALMQ